MSKPVKEVNSHGLPISFKPLLWSFRWDDIDIEKDKEDIILNTINEGSLDHWRWINHVYGQKNIRDILSNRLITEFHPESYRLAKVIFDLKQIRYAR